jgi:hypothetical protein
MYRHGDVLLIRRDDEPSPQPTETETDEAEIVVAEGEATGHAHRVRGLGATITRTSSDRIEGRIRLALPAGGVISHEEHATLVLEPGVYEVRHQQTYTQAGVWERVRD